MAAVRSSCMLCEDKGAGRKDGGVMEGPKPAPTSATGFAG